MYNNWFKDSELFAQEYSDKSLIGYQIQKDSDSSIPIGTQVVIFGYNTDTADAIRRKLYDCTYNFSNLQMIDLGNLRNKEKSFTIQILNELNESGVNVIVLGPDPDFHQSQLTAVKTRQNIAYVDKTGSQLFSEDNKKYLFENKYINKIKLIGYQAHLFHLSKLVDKKLNHSLSLGDIRNNMRDAEPALRDVSIINFMLECIRYSEIPGVKNTTPSGFTSEEACQLMRYFGLNTLTNFLAIYGYNPKYDFHDQGVSMISQLIWYYMEGLDQKKLDKPDSKENMTQYLVDLSDYELSLNFMKSDYSGKWWVEIPKEDEEPYLLPCSFMDYKIACNNEMPKRIMKEFE